MNTRAYRPEVLGSVRPDDLDADARAKVVAAGPDGEGPPPGPLRRLGRSALEFLRLIAVALVMAFILKSFLLQAFYIPSGSMLDTLQLQDRVLVEKLTYHLREPQRGEIIVFRRPGHESPAFDLFSPGPWLTDTGRSFLEGLSLLEPDEDRDLIKRVIGLPGETVEMIDGVVYINGRPLEESAYTRPETRDFPKVRVPGGHYFVMGDNRGNSLDSRFALGTIPEENIIGRAFVILWPPRNATLDMDTDYPGVGETPLPLGSEIDPVPPVAAGPSTPPEPVATPSDSDGG